MAYRSLGVDRFNLSLHQALLVVDHAIAGVLGDIELAGVHADGILGADFNAKAAVNALTKVQDELGGIFFNIGVRMFRGGYLNAPGGADGFAHHAGHTSGRAVLTFGQAMAGPQSRG